MTSNMNIYEGAFVNTETNILNENIQQIISVRIFDTETVIASPYNLRFIVSNNGDATLTITINSDVFPSSITNASFSYFNVTWIDTPINLNGRSSIIIPEGDWSYSFVVTDESGDTRHLLTEGVVKELEMGETPLRILIDDNAEDKFTPIKSKQAEIQIHSGNDIDISVFAEGGDNRFYVEIESQAEGIIFRGFLSISDLSQEFMPDPNIITLIATDGLGFLTDEPLLNFENETPLGIHPIISFLAWALAKTGLLLDIKACMNIREETSVPLVSDDSGAGHFYTHEHLDAKTFEQEIGVCEDCFTVLEKILGDNSFLTQYKGKWIIIRVDEMETGHEYFFTRYDYEGTWIENTEETFTKDIGVDLPLSFMNDDAQVSLERPFKSIKETFKYEYPEELLCNIDFERGDVRVAPDLTLENSEGTYDLDCWTKQKFPTSGTAIIAADNDAYIKRLFEFGYEKERYIVLTTGPAAANEGVMSQPVPIAIKEKILFSTDWRLASNVGSGDGRLEVKTFNILIISDSGDYYYLDYTVSDVGGTDPATWTGPFDGQRNQAINYSWVPDTADETEWVNLSVSAPPAPAAGKLYIGLFKEWQGSSVYEVDTYFSNLDLTLIPLVNGSYQRYTGQTHTVEQDAPGIKAIREKQVYISDAPRVAMKGALLKEGAGQVIYEGLADFGTASQIEIDGDVTGSFPVGAKITVTGSASNNFTANVLIANYSIIGDLTEIITDATTTLEIDADVTITMSTYVLAGLFYNAAKLTAGPGAQSDLSPYGQIQAFDVWNQVNRVMRIFDGTIDRTDSTTNLPDLLHKYILRDINLNTTNGSSQYRIFMLLHFEMDMHLCEWSSFFHEVLNNVIEKNYDGHIFNYITNE